MGSGAEIRRAESREAVSTESRCWLRCRHPENGDSRSWMSAPRGLQFCRVANNCI